MHICTDKLHKTWEVGTWAHLSLGPVPLPWGTPSVSCSPWADQDLSFGWWEWSHFTSPSYQVCWMGQDQDSLGTICWGKRVFSPVTYSSRSANDQTIQGWATEQEETEDDSFWSTVSLWMKIRCEICTIMYNGWDDQLWQGLSVTVSNSNTSFPSQSWMQEKNFSRNVFVFLYILYF